MSALAAIDAALFHVLNREMSSPAIDALMRTVALAGDWFWVLALAIPLLAWKTKRRPQRTLWLVLPLAVCTDALSAFLKVLFLRPRPFLSIPALLPLPVDRLTEFGFPSGHATNGFAVAVFLILVFRRRWVTAVAIGLAVVNGLSRIYLGVHYPFDVLGGALIGTAASLGVWRLAKGRRKSEPSQKRVAVIAGVLLASALMFEAGERWRVAHPPPRALPTAESVPPPSLVPAPVPESPESDEAQRRRLDQLRAAAQAQLNEQETAPRTLIIPEPPPEPTVEAPAPEPVLSPDQARRAEGRRQRENLPMGVVLTNGVAVYSDATGSRKIFEMMTGDFVRVYPGGADSRRLRVHPGLDVYLAATTRETRPAGERLPDRDGWVDAANIHVFNPDQAREFIFDTTPMTLGVDPSFSTYEFYERAMKNPDPVVHRVIGPRLIALADLHEDYVSSWSALYRDHDGAIRAAALAALRQRGVGNSRRMIEDLITRVAELTRLRVRGESEAEALLILDILKASGHPRVPSALASFRESWKSGQGPSLNQALEDILR